VRSPSGDDGALHDFARRLGHTVFVLGGPGTPAQDVAAVLDRVTTVADARYVEAAYGFVVGEFGDSRVGTMPAEVAAQLGVDRLTVLVVRPDRYIGMRRDGTDTENVGYLADYLAALAA